MWENRDARSAACNHGVQMLHVAVVIQACIHVAVVIHTCLLLPQAMMLRGREVRVSKTIIGSSVGDSVSAMFPHMSPCSWTKIHT